MLGDAAAEVFLEQARDFIGRQGLARIADDDLHAAVIERGGLHANRLGLRRMPVSIAEQVAQGHAQQAGIGHDAVGQRLYAGIDAAVGPFGQQGVQQGAQVAWLGTERRRARFHAVCAQVFIHQCRHAAARFAQVLAALQGFFPWRLRVAGNLLGRGVDDGQRRVKFMRHHGNEILLFFARAGFHFQGGTQFAFERGAPADFLLQRQRAPRHLFFQPFIQGAHGTHGFGLCPVLGAAQFRVAAVEAQAHQHHVDKGAQGGRMVGPEIRWHDRHVAQEADDDTGVEDAENEQKGMRRAMAAQRQPAGQADEQHDQRQGRHLHHQHACSIVAAQHQQRPEQGGGGRDTHHGTAETGIQGGQLQLQGGKTRADGNRHGHRYAQHGVGQAVRHGEDLLGNGDRQRFRGGIRQHIQQVPAAVGFACHAPEKDMEQDQQQITAELQAVIQVFAARGVVEGIAGQQGQLRRHGFLALQAHQPALRLTGLQLHGKHHLARIDGPGVADHVGARLLPQPVSGLVLAIQAHVIEHGVAKAQYPFIGRLRRARHLQAQPDGVLRIAGTDGARQGAPAGRGQCGLRTQLAGGVAQHLHVAAGRHGLTAGWQQQWRRYGRGRPGQRLQGGEQQDNGEQDFHGAGAYHAGHDAPAACYYLPKSADLDELAATLSALARRLPRPGCWHWGRAACCRPEATPLRCRNRM